MIADEPASWIDVSVPIRPGMVTFDGDPAVHLERTASLAGGAICNVSRIEPGACDFVCLPLLIPGSDGGPARAMVRRVAR